jgi:hypothetical protein
MRGFLPRIRAWQTWLVAAALAGALTHSVGRAAVAPTPYGDDRAITRCQEGPAPAAQQSGHTYGLDLQIRLGRVRIEFPWLRALPITPGRTIVVVIAAPPDAE